MHSTTSPHLAKKVTKTASIAALFTAGSAAHAQIVHVTGSSLTVGPGSGSAVWNIDQTGPIETNISAVSLTSTKLLKFDGSYGSNPWSAVGIGVANGKLLNLATTAMVGPSAAFASRFYMMASAAFFNASGFATGVSGYIGFKFTPDATVLYGWASVTMTTTAPYAIRTINEWAHDTSGAAIQVGQTSAIPEPATTAAGLGLLALGAAGLRRWRKIKQAA